MNRIGLVIIGRNEGDRLKACLQSVSNYWDRTVYVDSGSSDGSQEYARALGVMVEDLDMSIPFTAARARNAGLATLQARHPDMMYVQFIDGDCVLDPGWIDRGAQVLSSHHEVAAVCGRLREAARGQSIYNRLLDMEWNAPTGEIASCGGIAMFRISALNQVGGFNPVIIAGEEPELCVRLRLNDYRIVRIDSEMAVHDAAMTKLGQWWKRAKRAGHAYAQGSHLYGKTRFRHKVREVYSGLFWGGLVPVFAVVSALLGFVWPWAWVGVAIAILGWTLLGCRVYQSARRRGWPADDARLYSLFCVLAKLPHCQGILEYWRNRWFGRQSKLIEYKGMGAES